MAKGRLVLALTAVALVASAVPVVANEAEGPVNNDFATATFISEVPFSETADNTVASLELDENQPSCKTTRATLWYAFAPASDINMVAEAASTFRNTLAVYTGTGFADLVETGCSSRTTSSKVAFRALAGSTYFIQIGSAGRKRGIADIRLAPNTWQEKALTSFSVPVQTDGTNAPLVGFHGRPRPSSPQTYDMTVAVAGQTSQTYGVMTFGLVDREIQAQLLSLPPRSGRLDVSVGYRYDSSQYTCAVDSGEGTPCVAKVPIKDLTWLSQGDGQRAELFINVAASEGGTTLAERTITIPFAGQLAGLP